LETGRHRSSAPNDGRVKRATRASFDGHPQGPPRFVVPRGDDHRIARAPGIAGFGLIATKMRNDRLSESLTYLDLLPRVGTFPHGSNFFCVMASKGRCTSVLLRGLFATRRPLRRVGRKGGRSGNPNYLGPNEAAVATPGQEAPLASCKITEVTIFNARPRSNLATRPVGSVKMSRSCSTPNVRFFCCCWAWWATRLCCAHELSRAPAPRRSSIARQP
jgi:hypothetical protein